jgi:hypothetical protein
MFVSWFMSYMCDSQQVRNTSYSYFPEAVTAVFINESTKQEM